MHDLEKKRQRIRTEIEKAYALCDYERMERLRKEEAEVIGKIWLLRGGKDE